jgi:hypothetical protein
VTRCPPESGCRFCERTDCNQRAAPSYRFAFSFDEYTKKDCFFSPLLVHEAGKDAGSRRRPRRRLTPPMPDTSPPRFALASGAPAGTRADVLVLFADEAPRPERGGGGGEPGPGGTAGRAATEEGFRGKPDQTFVLTRTDGCPHPGGPGGHRAAGEA